MIDTTTALMTVVLVFFFGLQLLILISDRVNWMVKVVPIVACMLIVWAFYETIVGLLGYPVATTPEGSFRIVGLQVREPSTVEPGNIWVWTFVQGDDQPRAFALPYSKKLQEQGEEIRQKLASGRPVQGRFKKKDGGDSLQATPDLDLIPPPDTLPVKG